MVGLRIRQDIFIPEDPQGTYVEKLGISLPTEVANNLTAFLRETRRAKKYAQKINGGLPNEEVTVKAAYHICYHNESPLLPCGPEQEI